MTDKRGRKPATAAPANHQTVEEEQQPEKPRRPARRPRNRPRRGGRETSQGRQAASRHHIGSVASRRGEAAKLLCAWQNQIACKAIGGGRYMWQRRQKAQRKECDNYVSMTRKARCKECGGSAIREHGRRKAYCKEQQKERYL
jgi:hypothetical protein